MKEFPIPVVGIGPGSQVVEEEADYMRLPSAMHTYDMPSVHLEANAEVLAEVCGILDELMTSMKASGTRGPGRPRIELSEKSPEVVKLLNQSLGHGEVSVIISEPMTVRIQETVFAGVWRVQEFSSTGVLQHDALTASAIPYIVQQAMLMGATTKLNEPELRLGMMNGQAILNELQERARNHKMGQAGHVINLTLLPVTPEDLSYIGDAIGIGPVSILSRGYGNCRITSTQLSNVWWVQYFNSMDTLILNTLEIADVPEVAVASEDDFNDSIERIGEWLSAMQDEEVV